MRKPNPESREIQQTCDRTSIAQRGKATDTPEAGNPAVFIGSFQSSK